MPILFVWDFNGVLDKGSEEGLVVATNQVLKNNGYDRRMTLEECKSWWGLKYIEFLRRLIGDQDLETLWKLQTQCVNIQKQIQKNYTTAMDGAVEVLSKIKQAGHTNIVISAAKHESLINYLEITKLTSFFDYSVGLTKENAKFSELEFKTNQIKKFSQGKQFDKIIAIGDMEHDIAFGKAVGATTILFNPSDQKVKTQADHIIKDLKEILDIIPSS